MARNDGILDRPDPGDERMYDELVRKALVAKRTIESGFLELAESIAEMHETRLYRVKFRTFDEFCREELGFSRQTIYIYLSILQFVFRYGSYFDRERAIAFGHKKMRYITEGVNAIDKSSSADKDRERKKLEIFNKLNPAMPSTEIKAIVTAVVSR